MKFRSKGHGTNRRTYPIKSNFSKVGLQTMSPAEYEKYEKRRSKEGKDWLSKDWAAWMQKYGRKNITNEQYRKIMKHLAPFADADKDKVRNIDDCYPFDKKRHIVQVCRNCGKTYSGRDIFCPYCGINQTFRGEAPNDMRSPIQEELNKIKLEKDLRKADNNLKELLKSKGMKPEPLPKDVEKFFMDLEWKKKKDEKDG